MTIVKPGLGTRIAAVIAGICVVAGCRDAQVRVRVDGVPERIVSMSPGLTETLFALGVGDRVVGVTRFCTYPPEAVGRAKVGGFLDPNWEALVSLRPDLVVLMESHGAVEARLVELGIPSLMVDQHDVASALESFVELADACDVGDRGLELERAVAARLDKVAQSVADLPRPTVAIVIGRDAGAGTIQLVWAAASETFFDDVVTLAGGRNVLAGKGLGSHPEISREGLISLDPEVILDVIPDLEQRGLSPAIALADWRNMDALRAVKQQRVVVLDEPFMSTPGPRMAFVVEAVARALHPELGS